MNEIENPNQACPICGYHKMESEKRHQARCLKPGSIVGEHYLLGKVLGTGGFGITYLAKNLKTGETLAIKEYFPAEIAQRDVYRSSRSTITVSGSQKRKFYEIGLQNFEKEAKNLLFFQNLKGIVRVENYFRENGTAYLAMEYVNGISLKSYLNKRKKPLSEKQVLKMMRPVLCALEKIHEKGMIHRDISPENLILDRTGKVTLIDFGAARMSTGDETKSLTILLKHGYAPIEQYQSKGRQGAWTDIYALCATMYELMSAVIPRRSVDRANEDHMPTLKELAKTDENIHVSDLVSDVIQKGMEVEQEKRYQDIASFGRALYQSKNWRQPTNIAAFKEGVGEQTKYTGKLEANREQFLKDQRRRFEYERKKEQEKFLRQEIEREKLQQEYRRQQEYKQKKELEREEQRRREEQEFLKREYEKQEEEKRRQQKLREQENRNKKEADSVQKQRKALKQAQTKVVETPKKEIHYRTLESVKEGNKDLWYNPYEQEDVDKNISKKRKILLAFGFFSLFICAGIIFLLCRTKNETYVKFGTYPQSEITGSAITKEIKNAEYDERRFATVNGKRYRKAGKYYYVFDDIRWRVLERKDGKALLITDRILDAIIFSPKNEVISDWENSFIREWLNDYFYNAAFTEEEKKAIIESTIETSGVETKDKVFLLSTEDVTNRNLYFTNDSERISKQTVYAVRRGAQTGDESAGRWWLRTPGTRENTVQVVRANGSLAENSYTVMSNDCGVRPAIWVDESYFEE